MQRTKLERGKLQLRVLPFLLANVRKDRAISGALFGIELRRDDVAWRGLNRGGRFACGMRGDR